MIKLSVSKDITKDFQFQEIEESFEAVAKILLYNNWSCSNFKDGHRNKQNFVEAQHIALDFDNGLTLLQAKERFKDYWHIISTTRNHQKPKNSITCDRFRVILKLEDLVTDAATFEETYLELLKWNPESDTQTKDCSRFFYRSNTIEVCNFEGSKIKIYKPKAQVISIQKSFREPSSDDGRRARAYIKKMGPAIQGNNGQAHLFKVCMSLYNDFKLQDEDALAILKEWNQDNIPPWKEAELESIYQSRKRYANKEKEGRLLKEEPAFLKLSSIQNRLTAEQEDEKERERAIFWDTYKFKLLPDLELYCLPACVTLFAAPTKNGKTTVCSMIVVNAMLQGKQVLFISNELPTDIIRKNIRIAFNNDELFAEYWNSGKLVILDTNEQFNFRSPELSLRIIRQAAQTFDLIIFDQISFLGDAQSEGGQKPIQEQFVMDLCQIKTKAHIIFTQQTKSYTSANLQKIKPEAWQVQNELAITSFTAFSVDVGLLYCKIGKVGILKASMVRYNASLPDPNDDISRWRYTNGVLIKEDSMFSEEPSSPWKV